MMPRVHPLPWGVLLRAANTRKIPNGQAKNVEMREGSASAPMVSKLSHDMCIQRVPQGNTQGGLGGYANVE